jgi:hypothetical protein
MKTQKHQGSDNSARMESKYKLNLAQITSIVLTSAEAYFSRKQSHLQAG